MPSPHEGNRGGVVCAKSGMSSRLLPLDGPRDSLLTTPVAPLSVSLGQPPTLQIFYYWVNFGPLSRGSAACGYVVLAGLMAAMGWKIVEPLPPNVQMDWEAILRPTPEDFLAIARPWLYRARRRADVLDIPSVAATLPTALDGIKALNCF